MIKFPNGDRGFFGANTKVKGKKNVKKNRATYSQVTEGESQQPESSRNRWKHNRVNQIKLFHRNKFTSPYDKHQIQQKRAFLAMLL